MSVLLPSKVRIFSTLLFFLALALTRPAWALDVTDIRFGAHGDRTRLVLDLDGPADFRAFVLGDPYRMVIDLPDFDWHTAPITAPQGAGIQAVRHGNLQPGVSRIVLELSKPVAIRGAFMLPPGEGKLNRLVIDFAPVSARDFKAEISKIHGALPVRPQTDAGGNDTLSQAPPPSSSTSSSSSAPAPANKKPLVVIDPGHGGIDPGAPGANGTSEKNVTLALAKELKKQLEDSGQYRVLLTRDKDVFIKLGDRVRFARKHQADLFISLHADSIDKRDVRGASVYTLSEKASDAQTEKLAARENRADLIAGIDLSTEDDEVANILVDLAMRDTMNQSRFFAGKLVDYCRAKKIRVLETPHRYAGFAVLKAPDIPSVLVETGFMSNRKDADALASSDYRKNLAAALKKGVDSYFEQVRKNQRI